MWGAFYIFYLVKRDIKAAILDSKGIWINGYGFTAWEGIDDIYIYYRESHKFTMAFMGIRVKDLATLKKQVSLFIWATISLQSLFKNQHHISITSSITPNATILAFAQRYMSKIESLSKLPTVRST